MSGFLACSVFLLGIVMLPASASAQGPCALKPFPLQEVRLLEGPCLAAQEANRRYLHALEAERLLRDFRLNAGLDAPGEPLGGWERPDCEVRGHFVGHYLSACALMYASAGDEALKAKADYMVAELAKCQAALGGEYLSAFPESFWDRLESMQNPPWAPYYVIHKVMAGLYDVHTLCGNRQALEVLKGMATYFKKRHDKLSAWQWDNLLAVEFGGMAEVLYNLYGETHDPQHADLAHAFDRAAFLGPLALEHDNLSRIHANTHIPEIVGAARRYELLGDERYRTISTYFWDRVVNARTYATGGTSNAEHWPEPGRLAATLSIQNQESCTSYNMLKVTRHLIQWTAEPQYAEYYERTYFNSILGTQRCSDGMLAYFTPLACGSKKVFGTPNDAFWCCYGTGIESFSKLGDSIYFHDGKGIWVNLFVASEVHWKERGVRLEQRTRFPEEESTTFVWHVEHPTKLALRFLVPYWVGAGFEVRVNGRRVEVRRQPSSYASLKRAWKDGDTVQIMLPMYLHAAPMPDDPELLALLYGPLVLAGLTERPVYFLADTAEPDAWIRPVEGKPLMFHTVGQPADVTFVPLNRVIEEAYGVYFVVTKRGSQRHLALQAADEARRRLEARVVDRVAPMDESAEKSHNLQGENTQAGAYMDKTWRHAHNGWFSWDLDVLPNAPMTVLCTYWGDDVPPRTFDIMVDGATIATQSLNRNKPGEFFTVEYAVPAEITRGKSKVTVRFQAHENNTAGGVFECVVLKPGE